MKKALAIALMILVVVSLFASSQKYYPVSSEEWARVDKACHIAGVAGPSPVGPVIRAQLEVALDRAARRLGEDNALIAGARESLGMEEVLLSDDMGSLSYLGSINPEVYLQSNGEGIVPEVRRDIDSDWFAFDSKERSPFLEFLLEADVNDTLYARYVMPMGQKAAPRGTGLNYWDDAFHQNLNGVRYSQNFPYDAGVSIGSSNLNLIIARTKVSIGEGYTGNTAIGDNYDYQEVLKAGMWTRRFGMYLTITSFDSSHDASFGDDMFGMLCARFSGYKQLRHAATYEAVPLDNLRFSLHMINLLDTDSAFDFRMLNPLFILHNMYNYHEEENGILESNNMLSFDLSWSPAAKWNIYAQFTLDQIQVGGETSYYMSHLGYVDPNAKGGLLNVSYTDMVGEGVLNVYAEAVANMPAMYLNEKYFIDDGVSIDIGQSRVNPDNVGPCWSQDWLLGYKRTEEKADDIAFSGYKYGPDCVVLAAGGEYDVYGKCSVEARAMYMAHGEKGTGTDVDNYTFAGIDTPETVNKLPLAGETVEHTLVIGAKGIYWFKEWLGVYGGAAYSHRWNYRNTEGLSFGNLQVGLGLTITTK